VLKADSAGLPLLSSEYGNLEPWNDWEVSVGKGEQLVTVDLGNSGDRTRRDKYVFWSAIQLSS
jgi:hypothetical protein